jgi:phenylalanyl-tRNA synthetase beta chain
MVEVLNYPFVSSEQNRIFSKGDAVRLENPLQLEFAEMRKDLLPGLMSAAARNISRGMVDLALVEEGSVFHPSGNKAVTVLPAGNQRPTAEQLSQLNASIPAQPRHLAGVFTGDWVSQSPTSSAVESGYPQAISAVSSVARAIGLEFELRQEEIPGLHPGRGARLLVAAPEVATASEIAVMPALTQDLSLVVDVSVTAADLLATITDSSGELLESIRLVDQYQGESLGSGKKSLTFSLLFRSKEKTLTQAEANEVKLRAVEKCKEKFGAELRA